MLGYEPYRRIQTRRYACCTGPGWFRAAVVRARLEGWRLVDILRPTGAWHGRWACLFLERANPRSTP